MSAAKIVNLAEDGKFFASHRFRWSLWEFKVKINKKDKESKVECIGVNIDAIGKFYVDLGYRQNDKEYYLVKDNVVSLVHKQTLYEIVIAHTKQLHRDLQVTYQVDDIFTKDDYCSRDMIINFTIETLLFKMSRYQLPLLEVDKVEWLKDTESEAYYLFNNGALCITSRGESLMPYSKLEGYVWNTQIIDWDYRRVSANSSVQKVLDLAIGKEYRAEYMTALGYLTHSYVSKASNPIIFCIDRKLGDTNEGGNGKDFISQIVAEMRETVVVNGKQMTDNNRFWIEKMNRDTQIAWFSDIKKSFKMDQMYNIADGRGLEVRRMQTQPFEIYAKIGMTLQHVIEAEGRSDQRRQAFLFFTDTIGVAGGIDKILKEGIVFSDGWRGNWDSFYTFMVDSMKLYLKKGLVRMDTTPLKEAAVNQIQDEFDFEKLEMNKFYSWLTALEITQGNTFPTPRDKDHIRRSVQRWAKNTGLTYERDMDGNQRGFRLSRLKVYRTSRK